MVAGVCEYWLPVACLQHRPGREEEHDDSLPTAKQHRIRVQRFARVQHRVPEIVQGKLSPGKTAPRFCRCCLPLPSALHVLVWPRRYLPPSLVRGFVRRQAARRAMPASRVVGGLWLDTVLDFCWGKTSPDPDLLPIFFNVSWSC